MTKEVIVRVGGLQVTPDKESDNVEVIAPGEYYFRNGKHYLIYETMEEDETEVTKNIVKIGKDTLEVTRKGPSQVHMVFEKNKKNVTYYQTPFGNLLVGIEANSLVVEEHEDEIHCDVKYGLEINYEHALDCHINITAQSKGKSEFRILKRD